LLYYFRVATGDTLDASLESREIDINAIVNPIGAPDDGTRAVNSKLESIAGRKEPRARGFGRRDRLVRRAGSRNPRRAEGGGTAFFRSIGRRTP
jgi:hypothetical protein